MKEATQPFTDRVRRNLDVLDEMAAAGKVDLVRAVQAVEDIALAAQQMLGPAIGLLRSYGTTWQDIGDELGISRQAAQQRFGRHLKAWEDEFHRAGPIEEAERDDHVFVPALSREEAAECSAAPNGAHRERSGPPARRRLAEWRLSAGVLDGFLHLAFKDGPENQWNLPPREAHDAISRLSLEAQAWAESHGATYGQQKAVHKALTEAGYYNTGPRR